MVLLKNAVTGAFTGSNDFESYVTHFEFLSQLQKWQRKETVNGTETETEDRQQFFALRIQKLPIDIYRTFLGTLGRAMLRPQKFSDNIIMKNL